MKRFKKIVQKLLVDQDGAALVEYGLLVGLIAVVCIAAVTITGTKILAYFTNINTNLK